MRNEKIITTQTGMQIKVEVILYFRLEEFNKDYIAYTINDDDSYETATVFINEYDPVTNKIKNIDENDKERVYASYEETKQIVFGEY